MMMMSHPAASLSPTEVSGEYNLRTINLKNELSLTLIISNLKNFMGAAQSERL